MTFDDTWNLLPPYKNKRNEGNWNDIRNRNNDIRSINKNIKAPLTRCKIETQPAAGRR